MNQTNLENLPNVVPPLEEIYMVTKVVWSGWPADFEKMVRETVDWNSSPGYPWKTNYPTNRDLFLFDGVNLDSTRVAMVEYAVRMRWNALKEYPQADPIHVFVKPEPHKKNKVRRKSWRLISSVGLTDTLVDRILYGKWLDSLILNWDKIPNKGGWAPSQGGYRYMARSFRRKDPVSIDKSSWDWTVNKWHVDVLLRLVPRMMFGLTDEWRTVFSNRIEALFYEGNPQFKYNCGCTFTQLVTGIMKSGCLGTLGFNSVLQVASHLAAGGQPGDKLDCTGDDTVQASNTMRGNYLEKLRQTGALVKEVDSGWPIKFCGHDFDENSCHPTYRSKHMFLLSYLDPKFAFETIDSYRRLYALTDDVSDFLENESLRMFGPANMPSREYLREWYEGWE